MSKVRCVRGVGVLGACLFVAAQITPVRTQQGAKTSGEWPFYGADLGNSKYSPLEQINKDNFGRLTVAWRWKSANGFLSKTVAGGGELWTSSKFIFEQLKREDPKRWRESAPPFLTNFKATPIMVGGRLYLNTPMSVGAALDARTGETVWVYNPKSYEKGTTTMSAR